MLHQAWSDGSFFPIINRSAAAQLESKAMLLWTVAAPSWHEAMTLYHQWRGWKPYVPMDDDDVIYTSEDEEIARKILTDQKTHADVRTDNQSGSPATFKETEQ